MPHLLVFVGRRVLTSVLVILAASIVIFAMVQVSPGDPAQLVAERASGIADKAAVERARHELGLDRPMAAQYYTWVSGVARGDLGTSMRTGTSITSDLAARIPVTGLMVLGASVVALVLGVGSGLLGAMRPRSFVDRALRPAALFGISIPSFYLGALLVLLFAVRLQWVPAQGNAGFAAHILPWVALGLAPAGILSRFVRVELGHELSLPYVTNARARGAGRQWLVLREAMPNIGVPLLTALGTQIGLMVVGAILVETVFSWQGAALYFLDGVKFRDYAVIQSALLLFAILFIGINMVVDIISHAIDPRLRRATTEALT